MNSLSWLLYAAEVSERVSNLAGFLGFIGLILGLVPIGLAFVGAYVEDPPFIGKWAPWTLLGLYFVIELSLGTLACALPSSKTIYMIAASQAGEQIVTSPDAQEMMSDLCDIIKKRLKQELAK